MNLSDCQLHTGLHSDLLSASTPYASSAQLQPNLQETVCVGQRTHWLALCKGKPPSRIMQTRFKYIQILWTFCTHTNPVEIIILNLKNSTTMNSLQGFSWEPFHQFTGPWIKGFLLTHYLFVESTNMRLHYSWKQTSVMTMELGRQGF